MRLSTLAFALLALAACKDDSPAGDDTGPSILDQDGDGFETPEDCDDGNADIYPGAPEEDCADPWDYNCDGVTPLYADADGDGHPACEECDDDNAAVNPAAEEVCDGVDNDCDGSIDNDATDAGTWYLDNDGDGFGDATAGVTACTQPEGTVSDATDCNDTDTTVYPGANEVPDDGVDQDCDGVDAHA